MPSCASAQPTKGDDITQRDMLPTGLNLDECPRSPAKPEEDEDEDEDVDFNPFLKGTPSPDASSSLSSEVEGIDGVAFENRVQSYNGVEIPASEMTDEVQSFGVDDSERCDEENLVQTVPFPEVAYEEELPKLVPRTLANKDIGTSGQDNDGCCLEKDDDASSRPDLNGVMVKEAANNGKTVMNFDDEDAICKRTRARYSLASFTLDELESFLQETDDDGDLQLVDEEEEYRKFLAGVLLGGDGDGHSTQENGTVDEDEDNDADFEIELEEALESDPDERSNDKSAKGNFEPPRRRPETRQNRRQNASAEFKRKLLEQGKRPLRPLLPLMPIGHNLHSPTSMAKHTIADATPDYASLTANSGFINGFTLSQIGQLYCLVHEHVQLLIQIYSLCILDPSRQHIASQVEELILEMLHKRDQVVAWRSVPYPAICFSPSYICSLVSDGPHRSCLAQHTYLSASAFSAQRFSSTTNSQMPAILSGSQCEGQGDNACSWPVSSKAMDRPIWLPYINGPVISVLDVAPLNLAKSYIHDLHIAVEDLRRRHVESSCDIRSEREPLFPLGSSLSAAENDGRDFGGATSVNSQSGSLSSSQQPLKRSLAAAIVESTKKQSVALVPKEVAKLAQRFLPLFDQAMFPHKPPSMAVVNRVLFTDAEDELLALGIMEYNTDWKAIQQRFLPCKSKHQIFVRQKNRCSSKAPENPIKAVRRMKTSPLTAEEIQHIQEGLKIYKLDWMSICKFIVPHRDPSLLPRQWRVALGTQKSYKQDEAKKEKRRMYEKRRKMRRGADLPSSQQGSEEDYQVENAGGENSSGDDCIDDPEEAFVHEGFLADWRPGTSGLISLEQPCSFVGGHSLPGTMEQSNNHKFGKASCHPGNMHQVAFASNFQNPYRGQWTQTLTNPVSDKSWKMSSNQLYSFSYWGQQTQTPQLVKLAPNLPPVNLPQNVRVISQPAYKNHDGALAIVSTSGASNAVLADADQVIYRTKKVGEILPPKANLNKVSSLDGSDARQEESRVIKEKCNNDEISIGSDSEMHPLLFQASGDDRLRYYPSNTNTTTCSSFSFFSGSQPQLNLSLFHNPHPPSLVADRHNKSLRPGGATNPCATDFHPLLKEAEVASSCVSLDTGTNISCSVDRTSELDLEMHLSSTSTMVEAVERNDVMGSKLMMPAPHAENSGSSLNSRQISSPVCQQSKNLSLEGSKLVSGSQALVGLNDGIDRCNLEMVTDQSHPGIVMEQEELSDSDENLEENVEFECEEMADSEGEEDSGTELVGDTRMKEVQNLVTEKVMKTRQDQLDEPTNSHFLGSDISAPVNGSLPFLNLGLKSKGKDKVSKSWLSLDSQVQVCSSSATGECHARQKRSYTAKACPRKRMVQMQNQTIETAEQLDLANSTVTSRRPRKRTCRSNASLDAVAV